MSALIVPMYRFDPVTTTRRYGSACIHAAIPMPPTALPHPFSVNEGSPDGGVWRARRGLPPTFVCAPLRVLAHTRDQAGRNGALLEWAGDDGAPRQVVVGIGVLYDSRRLRTWMAGLGLSVPRRARYVPQYILRCLYGADDVDNSSTLPIVDIEVRAAEETVWGN